MVISFGRPQDEDVVSLIAAKKYARAVEILKQQLLKRGANPSLRMQLADVLILADKKAEAVSLLLPLADQYANEGFAAKAVSVLKKVQKVDPGRRDVDGRLAKLIQEKQREALAPPLSRPAATGASGTDLDGGPGLEIGLEAMAPISAPAPINVEESHEGTRGRELAEASPDETLPVETTPPRGAASNEMKAVSAEPVLESGPDWLPDLTPVSGPDRPRATLGQEKASIEDYDLLYLGEPETEVDPESILEPEEAPSEAAAAPMSAGQFADELMSLVDTVFQEFPAKAQPEAKAASASAPAPSRPIVVSPLFRDFSVDEMVAVIGGLKLLAFERGGVILREGEKGASLYMLTSGRVRAFRKDPMSGQQRPLGDLGEGAFFGELSILTGQPRIASVVALSRCELLELDRPTLEEIGKAHPHVWDVLHEFAARRAARR